MTRFFHRIRQKKQDKDGIKHRAARGSLCFYQQGSNVSVGDGIEGLTVGVETEDVA